MWRIISEKRKKSTESFLRVPHRIGKPGKWQGIFQSGEKFAPQPQPVEPQPVEPQPNVFFVFIS